MEKKVVEKFAAALDSVKPGAGTMLQKFQNDERSPALRAFAAEPVSAEEIEGLRQKMRHAEQRAAKHHTKIAQLQSAYDKLRRNHPKDPRLPELQKQLDDLHRDVIKMESELIAMRAETHEVTNLFSQATGRPADDVQDISMVVGYIAYPSQMRGPVPVYPVIECTFSFSFTEADQVIPDRLLLSWENRRYKVYAPGHESTPLAETDHPVEEHAHETFQRLYKHWGYWFLRIEGLSGHADFHITNDKVFRLQQPIEESLRGLSFYTREQLIADAGPEVKSSKGPAMLNDMFDRFEALLGKLPVARTGIAPKKGIIHARVVHRRRKVSPLDAQWVQLDPAHLEAQLKKIVGGPFLSLCYENTRPGVDFAQIIPRGEGSQGSDVWMRSISSIRGEPAGMTSVIPTIGKALPQEKFRPDSYASLFEDDVPYVLKNYVRRGQNDNRELTVSRIQTTDDSDDAREVDKGIHESIIANYLMLCQSVRVAAAGNDPNAQKVWPYMRDAVIFELPPSAYRSLFTEFFDYCIRTARLDPAVPITQHTPKQRKRVYDVIESGADAPFPEKLPFKSCFFAYGAGVKEPGGELLEREMFEKNGPQTNVGRLYGHLVTADGMVIGFRHLMSPTQEGIAFTFDRNPSSALGEKWDRPHTLAPWVINALISYVNEHKTLVEQGKRSFGYERLVKRTSKQMNIKPPVPPPFYVVYLKDEFMRERVRERSSAIKRHIDWQHRWKVRGHDCIRFQRGPLPILPDIEEELTKRHYKIFTDTQPDADTFADLLKRGVPAKRNDEWIAILKYWRADYEKGPDGKPMIESVRRSAKEWTEAS